MVTYLQPEPIGKFIYPWAGEFRIRMRQTIRAHPQFKDFCRHHRLSENVSLWPLRDAILAANWLGIDPQYAERQDTPFDTKFYGTTLYWCPMMDPAERYQLMKETLRDLRARNVVLEKRLRQIEAEPMPDDFDVPVPSRTQEAAREAFAGHPIPKEFQ